MGSAAPCLVFAELKELLWRPRCCLQLVVGAGRRAGSRALPAACSPRTGARRLRGCFLQHRSPSLRPARDAGRGAGQEEV